MRLSEWAFFACNDKAAVRDALYAFFESHLDPETPPPPEWGRRPGPVLLTGYDARKRSTSVKRLAIIAAMSAKCLR